MTIPKINSAHGSDTRNILNAAIDSINAQGKSIQDLVAEGQLTPGQYAELIKMINGMIDKNGVGEVKWANISQEVRDMMLGDTPPAIVGDDSVSTTNIVDGAVTREKLSDHFMDAGRVAVNEPIDTVYKDGNYVVESGNVGTFPPGENSNVWAMNVKTVGTWTYQEIFKLTYPGKRYLRYIRNSTGALNEWVYIGEVEEVDPFTPDMIPDKSVRNKMLEPNFLYSGRIESDQSIDTLYHDGTYMVAAGNIGTFPSDRGDQAGILEVKRIEGSWTYQTLYSLYNPHNRYVRLVRSITGTTFDWHKYQIGEFEVSSIPDGSITAAKLHESALTPGTSNKVYKILMVGNSFALDVTSYLHNIAASAGIDIVIGILYRDGEGLASHYDNAINKTNTYTYYKRVSSAGTATNNTTYSVEFDTAVTEEEWDLITFQQRSGHSEDYTSYQPYLNDLKTYIEGLATNTDVEFGILQTWAYSTSRRTNQEGMYDAVNDAYQQAMNDADIGILIPSGTAIQSARANSYLVEIDDELTNDGIHLGELGDYITGLTMFESLLAGRYKKDLFSDVKYAPNDVTKFHVYLSKVIAKNAVSHPFKITDIQST